MTFDVEKMWDEFCPGIYSRLGLRCVDKHVTDDLYHERAWARFLGGNIGIKIEMEGADVIGLLGPITREPEWHLPEVAAWLGERWMNKPGGDRGDFQQLGTVLERRWSELQELFSPDRVEASLAKLEETRKLQEAERRRHYFGE